MLSTLSVVLAALFGAIAFHERLSRLQSVGVSTTIVGVVSLAVTRA